MHHHTASLPPVAPATTDPARRRSPRPRLASTLRSVLLGAVAVFAAHLGASSAHAQGVNLALNKNATALSTEYGSPAAAVDGNPATRWGSNFTDSQWIRVDLGAPTAVGRVVLTWETAYGRDYVIQGSNVDSTNSADWTSLAPTVTNGNGGVDEISVSGTFRFIRIQGIARGTGWGYSLWELEIYAPAVVVPAGDLAQGKTATASSIEAGHMPASLAVDNNPATRWSSAFADPQWLRVDLGAEYPLSRVVLSWETACASAYVIEGSNVGSDNGPDWTPIAPAVTNGAAGVREIAVSGSYRYVRVHGTARATPWGYSLLAFEVYGDTGGNGDPEEPPVQTTNQTIKLIFPDLAYAKINVSPAPLSVTPTPEEGNTTPSVRNAGVFTYYLTFAPNTTVTLSKNQFSPTQANTDIRLAVTDWSGDALAAQSITTLAVQDAEWHVQIFSTGTGGDNRDHTIIPDPYVAPQPPAINGSFPVNSPANGAVITSTRRPTLSWSAVSGATSYEVFVNVTRNDYDWFAPGRLLDRYTSVGTVAANVTSFTLADDLPDRWTYNWYVVATTPGGTSRSDLRTFSVYLPHVEQRPDGVALIGGKRDLNKNGVIDPYENWELPIVTRVNDLLGRMTSHEKTMQMFFNAYEFPLAGFTFGPLAVEDIANAQQASAGTRLGIPIIDAGDTIHGYKTSYPIQPGLAAGRDLDTVWEMGDIQRREELAVGSRGTLSPLAEVGTKALYPRIQEGCGEDADLAAGMVRAFVAGLQGGPEVNPHSLWITVKHWPGQGAGGEGGIVYDGTTIHYHMRPWHAAIEAGASGIMPGYAGSWLLGPDGWGAGDDPGIIAYLRDQLGYDGLICSDWLPVGAWVRSANAGSDVMGGANPGEPGSIDAFMANVPATKIDAAVRRILDLKFRLGLFEDPYRETGSGTAAWHTAENVALARRAARQSMTLLKNDGMLPLRASSGAIVIAGPRATDHEAGAIWRSAVDANGFGSLSIYQAVKARAEAAGLTVYQNAAPAGVPVLGAIVVVGEKSYTHGTEWPTNQPYLPGDLAAGPAHDFTKWPDQFGIIQGFRDQGIPVTTVVYSPRPYVLTSVNTITNALLVIYRPGDEGAPAVAETLFGDNPPSGKLPWQLPRSMAQLGTDNENNQLEKWDIPYDLGATEAQRAEIRAKIAAGLPVPPIYGDPLYQFGAGIQGYGLVDSTPPAAFALSAPANGVTITGAIPALAWAASSDAQTGIQRYEVYVDGQLRGTTRTTSFALSGSLGNGTHTWFVRACNWADGVTQSPTFTFTLNDTTPPPAFTALFPAAGSTAPAGAATTFIWEQTLDAGSGTASYTLQIDGVDRAPAITPSAYVSPTVNLALDADVDASSTEYGNPQEAADGRPDTRWASRHVGVPNADTESITLDLGAVYSIKRIELRWEAAYGKQYVLETSLDGLTDWRPLATVTNGDGGTDDHVNLSGAGRHVRMRGVQRGSGYGYSLWEFSVYGTGTEQTTVSNLSSGSHTWRVRATDGAGNATLSNGPLLFTK